MCRFYGSYEAVYGGWAGNAFTALTGGVAEKVKTSTIDPDYPVATPDELFTRVRNALSNGAIVSATVYATPVSIRL
jgi:Calpain family cysteine protease